MGNYKVAGAKLNDGEYAAFETYANTHNMSISAILKLCISNLIDGNLDIEKGELVVNHDGYAVSEEIDTLFGQKVDRKFNKLRERGYPESFIQSLKDQILNGIDSQIDMLPKKFDARRVKEDWGA